MNWSEFLLFLLNWDWFDLIRAIYQSVSCPKFCCHSCTNLIKVAWIRVGKINKHEVYHMEELRKSKKLHEFLKFSNQVKKTQSQLKQIEYWSGFFFYLQNLVWLRRNLLELCYYTYIYMVVPNLISKDQLSLVRFALKDWNVELNEVKGRKCSGLKSPGPTFTDKLWPDGPHLWECFHGAQTSLYVGFVGIRKVGL